MDNISVAMKELSQFEASFTARIRGVEEQKRALEARLTELKPSWDEHVYAGDEEAAAAVASGMDQIKAQISELEARLTVLSTWREREAVSLRELHGAISKAKREARERFSVEAQKKRVAWRKAREQYIQSVAEWFESIHEGRVFTEKLSLEFTDELLPPEWKDVSIMDDELFQKVGLLPQYKRKDTQ